MNSRLRSHLKSVRTQAGQGDKNAIEFLDKIKQAKGFYNSSQGKIIHRKLGCGGRSNVLLPLSDLELQQALTGDAIWCSKCGADHLDR